MTSCTLLNALLSSNPYPHTVQNISYLQTHLSYVILTGEYAYKIKKAVNLGFQDFTTLEQRKYYCELERSLNQMLAPDLYIDIVPITGTEENPVMGGDGPVIEWAIRMHQFPESDLLSTALKDGRVTVDVMADLAEQTARFHEKTEVSHDGVWGTVEKLEEIIDFLFYQIRGFIPTAEDLSQVDTIDKWRIAQFQQWHHLLVQRKKQGFVRACHGDFHLGNMVLFRNKPMIFDRIEFNEDFRWTDVVSDIGFLAMDLTFNGHPHLAYYFINRYLEYTGDYDSVPLLRFYMNYRAMVRALVAGLTMEQNLDNPTLAESYLKTCREYLNLAEKLCQPTKPSLTITHGISGSGKSTVSSQWMMSHEAIRVRSDVERKRLAGLPIYESSEKDIKESLYSKASSERTFERLHQVADELLSTGVPVIVDATFLKQKDRQWFKQLADKHGVPFHILDCPTPSDEALKARLYSRMQQDCEPSDATYEVACKQKQGMEPLTASELQHVVLPAAWASI